jgi:uncharacterized membrane protein
MPKSRIEAFSDGVFAIVITLLVLEFKVPSFAGPIEEQAFLAALLAQLPLLLSCIVSFVVIAVIWVAHHQFLHSLRQADWLLLWLNNLLLLFIVFIPIPTWMIGAYPSLKTPALSYGLLLALSGLSFAAMRYYASYVADLVDLGPQQRRRAMTASIVGPALYAVGALVAWPAPRLALAIYALVPLVYFLRPPGGRRAR